MNEYYLNCVHCGKQNLIEDGDPFDVKCEFGDHPVRQKKEENMITEPIEGGLKKETPAAAAAPPITGALPPVPPKPDLSGLNKFAARKKLSEYYHEHAAEMLADFHQLGDVPARERWGCSKYFWIKFHRTHGLPISKHSGGRKKKVIPAGPGKEKVPSIIKLPPAPEWKSETDTTDDKGPVVATVVMHIDMTELDAKLQLAREELRRLNELKLAGLPKFRWWWWPSVQLKWLEIYERLMVGR